MPAFSATFSTLTMALALLRPMSHSPCSVRVDLPVGQVGGEGGRQRMDRQVDRQMDGKRYHKCFVFDVISFKC